MNRAKTKVMHLLLTVAVFVSILLVGQVHVDAATEAPTGLEQTNASQSSVTIKWSTLMQNDICYYWRISDSADFAKFRSDWAGSNGSASIFSLNAGMIYYVQIGTSETRNHNEAPEDTVWSTAIEVVTQPERVVEKSIVQTGAATTSVSVSWDAVEGAEVYQIAYYVSGTNRNTAANVTSNTNSITLTGLKKNTKYYVDILAGNVSAAEYTAWSNDSASAYNLRVLPTKITGVKIKTFHPYGGPAYFEYGKSDSADGYEYIVYDNAGKKLLTDKTTSSSSVRIGDKISKDQFYRIKVRGYVNLANNKVEYGEWSDLLYFARNPYDKVSLKASGKSIKASWKKVTGATSYTVYVSTNKESGYKKAATVDGKKTSVTIKKYGKSSLKSKKTYYVKIVANKKVKVNKKYKTFTSTAYYDYAKSITIK